MKTIFQGDRDYIKAYKYFYCKCCGWGGKAERSEYKHFIDQYQQEDFFYVDCPCCHNRVKEVFNGSPEFRRLTEEELLGKQTDYWENR